MGSENLIAHPDAWGEMVERSRKSETLGILYGLDEENHRMRIGAGNAVIPQVAEWIARKLLTVL
jgi:DNA (cytosine-5)-methyltransferase 1